MNEANAALCQYAEQLTRSPETMTADNVATLRHHGFDDAAIHDATQIVGYFNYINRVADALGIDEEPHVKAWEQAPRTSI